MIGIVDIEVFEFSFIYKLDIVVVLINCLMICKDMVDLVYMIEVEKIQVIIEDIKICIVVGQLVLVGIILIEKFEVVFCELIKVGIKYNVLNVKFYVSEVDIVVQVGYFFVVIIVINMVGCGIDIMFGGSWQVEVVVLENLMLEQIEKIKVDWQVCYDVVLVVGGLYIIGIECYEFCCIDNQLCGCVGCQGDVGFFCFYLLMEDVLMCIFVFDCVFGMMCKLGMKSGEVIEYLWVIKVIVNVQCKVESCNFDICKQLLEYDDVVNDQCWVIYIQCNELLDVFDVSEIINSICEDVFKVMIDVYILLQLLEEMWDIEGLQECLKNDFDFDLLIKEWLDKELELYEEILCECILQSVVEIYQCKEEVVGVEMMCYFEKGVMLQILDLLWKEYLVVMDYLCQGIYLCGYVQKDLKQEYKCELFLMFVVMLELLKYEVISILSKVQVWMLEEVEVMEQQCCEEVECLVQMQQFSYQSDDEVVVQDLVV